MKTFVVPLFAVVEALDERDAEAKVGESLVRMHGNIALYLDEKVDAFTFDPEKHEPHSVLDKEEMSK